MKVHTSSSKPLKLKTQNKILNIVATRTPVRYLVGKSASFIAVFLVGRSFQLKPAPCTETNYYYAPDGPKDQQCVLAPKSCDPKQSFKNKVFQSYFLEIHVFKIVAFFNFLVFCRNFGHYWISFLFVFFLFSRKLNKIHKTSKCT